jgi:hypothetical protein
VSLTMATTTSSTTASTTSPTTSMIGYGQPNNVLWHMQCRPLNLRVLSAFIFASGSCTNTH